MDQNTQQSPMNSTPSPMGSMPSGMNTSHEGKKVGPIVATLVIVLILIIAALYLFASRINKEPVPSDNGSATVNSQQQSNAAPTVAPITNNSDDPATLQADLNSSTKNLDQQNF